MGVSADSIRAVGESDLLEFGRVARSTWQNWIKHGLVQDQPSRTYGEEAVVEVVAVGVLLTTLDLRAVNALWRGARTVVVETALSLPLDECAELHVLADPYTSQLTVARN